VLKPVIEETPEEYRSCLEYANAMLETGESYKSAIAVLRLGSLYGLRDPRFVATLGGMLFMDGQFTEADKVFEESMKHGFSRADANTVHYKPRDFADNNNPMRLSGEVAVVKAGYSFIVAPGYPRFLCPGTKWSGLIMTPQLKVKFEPAFSARGAQGEHPQAL
jgi:hypothetical protein